MKQTLLTVAAVASLLQAANATCGTPTAATVSTTNITCSGSGQILVTAVGLSGQNIPLDSCYYSLYDATNATIVKPIQNNPQINGLDSGTYVLHISHNCGASGLSADYTTTVHLTGHYNNPVLSTPTTTVSSCNTGSLSVTATQGYGSYSYCLVDSLNTPISPSSFVRPLQPTGFFDNLPSGDYFVRVYDQCSGFVTMPVTVAGTPSTSPFGASSLTLPGCSTYSVNYTLNWYVPIDANNRMWVTYPDGTTDTIPNHTSSNQVSITIPFSKLTSLPAVVTFGYKNPCGAVFTTTKTFKQPGYRVGSQRAGNYSCSMGVYNINTPYMADSVNTDLSGVYNQWDAYSLDGGTTWIPYVYPNTDTILVPTNGSRQVIYRRCGQLFPVTVAGPYPRSLSMAIRERSSVACNGNSGIAFSVWGGYNGNIDSMLVHAVSMPAGQTPIPDFYFSGYPYQLLNLVPGAYSFLLTDQCGATQTLSITLTGSNQNMSVTPKFTCGASTVPLNVHYYTDKSGDMELMCRVLNSAGVQVYGSNFYVGNANVGTGFDGLTNPLPPGIYTVELWKTDYYNTFSSDTVCGKQVFTVDARLPGPLSLGKSNFATCTNNAATGTLIAIPQGGIPPYTYTLYKNSVAPANQVGSSQSSNVFMDLDANAVYIITATDQCGAGSPYSTSFGNVLPTVNTSAGLVPCAGDSITLSITNNSNLFYQWTKNGVAIPGATSSSYTIPSVTSADSGAYSVNITANSCLLSSTQIAIDPNACGIPFPLPLDLLSFNGTVNTQQHAVLNWKTAQQESGTVFSVWYSTDGKQFSKAGTMPGDAASNLYTFTHSSYTLTGKTFYKLLLTDNTGNQKYSPVIVLKGGMNGSTPMEVSPVPFTSAMNITYTATNAGNITLQLADVSGRILRTETVTVATGVNSISMHNLDTLPGGIYFLKAVDEAGQMQAIKVQK